ncbi:MAG: hypothetical protein HY519_02845, partial [Candidatus Aenigmarchaeota archaeon]|nr:hypothetical protein [Candidatus Aenigmarchaeota archaeon]
MEMTVCHPAPGVKRGQVYSLIAAIMALPIFLFIAYYATSAQNLSSGGIDKVVADQMHDLERGISDDFSRGVDIAAKRAILALTDRVIATGSHIDNPETRAIQLMLNGTLYGNTSYLMDNNTLEEWRQRILAVNTGLGKGLNYTGLQIDASGAALASELDIAVNVTEAGNRMLLSRQRHLAVISSFEGYEDALYAVHTNGYVKRSITLYPYTYYAYAVVSGNSSGSCFGNVTFNASQPDSSKILVVPDAAGIAGFLGVVSETDSVPAVSCNLRSAPGAVAAMAKVAAIVPSIFLDNITKKAWSLPVRQAVENGYYFPGRGPDIFQRLQGNLTAGDGIESFVNLNELQQNGVQAKA